MRIWLSFDLGVSGDYEGMYAWLDDKRAKECGSSVASYTRHARRPDRIARFESIIRARATEFVDDSPYRLDAFDDVLLRGRQHRHPMSLVDAVLRSILADANVRIDAMLTFNYSDFSSICSAKGVEML